MLFRVVQCQSFTGKLGGQGAYRTDPVQEGKQSVNRCRKSGTFHRERGQGLVEFALVIPFLLLLMIGIFEFGYFFFVYTSVNTAAREAARYGAGAGISERAVPYYKDCTGILDRAQTVGRYANIPSSGVVITYDKGPGTTSLGNCGSYSDIKLGDRVVVSVDVTYHPIILQGTIPDLPIHSDSARTIIVRMQVGD